MKWDYDALFVKKKVLHEAFEDKCQMWTQFSKGKLWLVNLNIFHDLHDNLGTNIL